MTCESALRVAEWRLRQQQRRALVAGSALAPAGTPRSARVTTGPSAADYWLLWMVVGVLVLGAMAFSGQWTGDEAPGNVLLLPVVALVVAALIVLVVYALTFRGPQRR